MKQQSNPVIVLGRTILVACLVLGHLPITLAQSSEDLWDVHPGRHRDGS